MGKKGDILNEYKRKRRRRLNKKCAECSDPITDAATYCQKHAYLARNTTESAHKAHETKLARGVYHPIGREYIGSNGFAWVKITHGENDLKGISGRYGNYAAKHRYVMEQHIGRKLERNEHVHHIDGNRTNNDISNLLLIKAKDHNKLNHFIGLLQDTDKESGKKLVDTLRVRFPQYF